METVLSILVTILGLIIVWIVGFSVYILLGVIAKLVGVRSDKWDSEDQAEYEFFNPDVKREDVHFKRPPTPLQTRKTTVTVAKSPEKPPVPSHKSGEISLVSGVMVRTPYYCHEDQSDEEALKIMQDLGLPYLPVLDGNLRVVGMVSMENLKRRKKEDPPESGK